jgi:hypothetical protein
MAWVVGGGAVNQEYCALQCWFCIIDMFTKKRICGLSDGEDDIGKMTECPKERLTPEARAACPGEVTRREPTGPCAILQAC